MTRPQRIQRSSAKGHRHPPGTVFITRPGPWGNPFNVKDCRAAGYDDFPEARCVVAFRAWLANPVGHLFWDNPESERRRAWILANLHVIREAKCVACWCAVGEPCHGDVLIELACGSV